MIRITEVVRAEAGQMTNTHVDVPGLDEDERVRPWALKASLVVSTVGIVFSLLGWLWANGQQVEYTDLELVEVRAGSDLEYVPLYLAAMLILGLVALALAAAGARAGQRQPWVVVVAGAMAMFLVMVPVVFFVGYEVSHWSSYPGD